MIYETDKVTTNTKKNTQGSAGSAPSTPVNNSSVAPQKNTATAVGPQYVPGSNIDTAKTGLVDAANNLKIQGFANAAQKYNTQPAAADPSNINYAEEMKKVLAMPQTLENQQKMQALFRGRNLKTALNPDEYGQYANDAYAKAANDYLSYIIPQSVDTNKYLDSMRSNADNRYQAQMDLMQQQHDIQNKAIAENYEKLRNQEFVNAARRALGTEEVLAAQGLGRGKSNAPSSGFGETSRIMAQTSLNNNIANSYLAEQKALEDLRNQLAQNQIQAYMDHADRASNIDLQALDQANNDRNHYFNVQNANIQNNASREMLDWEKESFGIANNEGAREFDVNAALEFLKLNQDDRHHNDQISLERDALAQNKGGSYSGNGGFYDGYTFGDNSGGINGDLPFTMTDDDASNYVRAALQEGGKTNAIYALAYLSGTGQISKMAEQTLIDELELTQKSGWFK